MRRYSGFQKASKTLTDLLVISKIMFSANLLDVIESQGPILSFDSPLNTVTFVRFDYGEGIGYALLCCKDMLIAAAAREGGRKVFGDNALRIIRSHKGTSYVYSILLENLPNNIKPDVERAIDECRELRYPDSLLGTQLYGLKIGNQVLINTGHAVILPAELDNQKQILILPSDTLLMSENKVIILSSLALDFSIALANNVKVSGLFIPRTGYDSLNDIITSPPAIVIPWENTILLDDFVKQSDVGSIKVILKKIARYLIRAHELGITHLWLDPRKILLKRPLSKNNTQVFITGFLGDFPKEYTRLIDPSYCDPYLLLGIKGLFTDVYSLGMIILKSIAGSTLESRKEITLALNDALTGVKPSNDASKSRLYLTVFSTARKDHAKLIDTLSNIVKNSAVRRRDKAILNKVKNKKLREIIVKCLSLNLDDRPKSITELLDVLQ